MLVPLLIVLAGIAYFAVVRQRAGVNTVLLLLLLEWFGIPRYGDWAAGARLRVSTSMALWSNSLFNLFTITLALAYLLTVLCDVIVIPVRVEMIRLRIVSLAGVCGVLTLLLVLIAPFAP